MLKVYFFLFMRSNSICLCFLEGESGVIFAKYYFGSYFVFSSRHVNQSYEYRQIYLGPRPSFLGWTMAGHWIALKPEVETRIVFIFSITQKKYFSKSGALDILETFLYHVFGRILFKFMTPSKE